jgi:hypothetical protein
MFKMLDIHVEGWAVLYETKKGFGLVSILETLFRFRMAPFFTVPIAKIDRLKVSIEV